MSVKVWVEETGSIVLPKVLRITVDGRDISRTHLSSHDVPLLETWLEHAEAPGLGDVTEFECGGCSNCLLEYNIDGVGWACLRWRGDVLSALGLGDRPNLDIWKVPPLTLELILDGPISDPDRRAFSWRARVTGVQVEHPSSDYLDKWHRPVRTTAATGDGL